MAAPNEFLSGVIGKVTFVNKWPLLLKATQDDDTPTPGYLFKEISAITYESGNNCQCLIDFLVERLEKKSCHIKYKVLKIMLHVVEQGHPAFCEGLRRKATGIQSSAKCSGPPDPLHGMAPYVAVRKAAKALSERLFDTEVTPCRPASSHSWTQGHMTHGKPQSREGTTKKMEGIGNTAVASQKPVTIESLGESVKGGLQQIASKLSGENKSAMTFSQADTGYKPLHGYDPTSIHSPPSPLRQGLLNSRSAQWSPQRSGPTDYSPVLLHEEREETKRGTRPRATKSLSSSSSPSSWRPHQGIDITKAETPSLSGLSRAPEESNNLIDTSSVSRGRQSNGSKSSDQLSCSGSDLSERLASVSIADWSEEISTVQSFISNDQPTPTKEELQKFVKRSSLLNCEKMIELLTSHLMATDSYPLRCLFGIEGILKEDLLSSDIALSLLSPHLTSIQSSQDKAIRSKALKILRQLERLEADTNLDQPLMPEGQLISQAVLEDVEADILGSTLITTPLKTACASEESSVLNGTTKSSQGSLFSGMTVATRMAVPSREQMPVGSSTESPTRKRESDVGHAVTDLLMDSEVMLSSNSSEGNLLHSDAEPFSATSLETQRETTRGSVIPCVQSSTNVSLDGIHLESSDTEAAYKCSKDPIMSREAGFADLWNTVSPNKESSKASHQHLSHPNTTSQRVNVPSQQQPNMALQQPVMTAQHISQLYPQLSSANLSGTSSTPINLAKKPVTGFGFVVESNAESQKASVSQDAFSFIQDAMKSSKS